MNPNTRIKLEDTTFDAIFKMSEGNPGAITVLMRLMESKIDQASAIGCLGSILSLDSLGIYGSGIWILYKDICGEDIEKTMAVLRSWQLGFLDENSLLNAIANESGSFRSSKLLLPSTVDELLAKVKKELGPEWVSPVK